MEVYARFALISRTVRAVSRTLYTSTVRHQSDHHHFLIIGAGTAGVATASRLANSTSPEKVTLVEPEKTHYYQPLWTLVGAGIRQVKDSGRPMSKVIPPSVNFISDRVVKFEPDTSRVHLASGKQLSYDFLILALGISLRFDKIPGAKEALEEDPRVISNYSLPHLEKTFKAYQAFQGGRAVFTLPCGPIKCAGAPQKAMYLFEDYLRKHHSRDKADIHYYTSLPKMFSVDKYAESLRQLCVDRNINMHLQHHLVESFLEFLASPKLRRLLVPMAYLQRFSSMVLLNLPPITTLVNDLLSERSIPDLWLPGTIIPVSKGFNSSGGEERFRPNSLTSTTLKVNGKAFLPVPKRI